MRKTVELTTVASWSGTESKEIKYKATKSPWVVKWGYTPTSKLGSKFDIIIFKTDTIKTDTNSVDLAVLLGMAVRLGNETLTNVTLVEDTGEYTMQVRSSGCQWWVKVGVE